ncbi:DNA double-strand break repair nuclease NurA [Candidatus Bathyarchaeota archaeon]|nr:MAG: DNA double-strand break repair nuclease NurA [Candidatus Bathyarchaeota archaeon]
MSNKKNRWTDKSLPPDFRETYFSLFSGSETETLHADLYHMLIDEGTDIIIQQLKEYNKRRRDLLVRIRDRVRIKKATYDDKWASNIRVVASDAGNNGVDLRSAFIPLYASTALLASGWSIIDEPIFKAGKPDVWAEEFRTEQRESLLAFEIQYEVTEEAVERWEPDFVLVDGSLLLNFWLSPSPDSTKDYIEDFKRTLLSSISLLHYCYEKNIPIAGFVKRTRINHMCRKLRVSKLRDTALMDLILGLGEYTVPEEAMKGRIVNEYRKEAEKLGIPGRKILEFTSIYSSYIRTGFTTPFRLELPKYCLNRLDEICKMVFTTSEEESGIPFSISEADRLTKVTTNISNIRTLMIYSKALDLVRKGEMEMQDLTLLALQHGEPWTLTDRGYISSIMKEGKE